VTYFRCWPRDEDPAVLLEPSEQYSTPWGEPERGPCDKCGGSGETLYRCRSCLVAGSLSDCPACSGRIGYPDRCPTCEGTGDITRTRRRGVSVFPTVDGLYYYLAERDAHFHDKVVLELEGELSDDWDLDADAGALLIHPRRIVAARDPDAGRVDRFRALVAREDQSEAVPD
jgi:hypothetical protein